MKRIPHVPSAAQRTSKSFLLPSVVRPQRAQGLLQAAHIPADLVVAAEGLLSAKPCV